MRELYEKFVIDREHESLPIEGYGGVAFRDYTHHTIGWDWTRIDEELTLCMAMQNLDNIPKVSGPQPPELKYGEFPREDKDDKYPINLSDLTPQQRRKLFYFRKQSILPWYFVLDLKPSTFTERSNDTMHWHNYEISYTRQCIETLPFKVLGRVVIYASWATSNVPCHRDQLPGSSMDQMISFNPGGYRPIYIYDAKEKKKHYLPEHYRAFSYNTNDYHGVDSVPHFSYTVRVDGQYES